jgi:TolB-like protein
MPRPSLLPALLGAALAYVGSFSGTASAQAAHRRVAVLRVDFPESMPVNNKDFLNERLIVSLAAADFQVFAGMTVNQMLKQGSRLEACRQPSCYQEIAQRLGVEYLVTGNVEVQRKNYTVILDLIAGRDGRSVGQSREPCELCGIAEVGGKMDRQVLALRGYAETATATAPARFSIESRPPGAEVTIDGKPSGVTPLSVDVPAGQHQMAVKAAGFRPAERNVYADSGMNGYLALDLAPEGGITMLTGSGGKHTRLYALSAMVLGAAAVAVGFVVKHYDGQFVGCNDPVGGPRMGCRVEKQRETSLEAGALFGAGGLLFLGGTAALFLAPSEASSPPSGPATTSLAGARGGWVLGTRGRF